VLLAGTAVRAGQPGQQHVPITALSEKMCQSRWVQSSERMGGYHHSLVEPAELQSPSYTSCSANCCAKPCLPALLASPPQDFFYRCWCLGHHCSWPHPGLLSHCYMSCGLPAGLSAPLRFPQFRKSPCTLRWSTRLRIVPAPVLLASATEGQCWLHHL